MRFLSSSAPSFFPPLSQRWLFFPLGLLSLSPFPAFLTWVLNPAPFSQLFLTFPTAFDAVAGIFHRPLVCILFPLIIPFSLSLLLSLCHIHNYKSSRRELTHTWPRSVVPAVPDNLSTSLKRGGRDRRLLGLLFLPQLCIHLFFFPHFSISLFALWSRCKETSGAFSHYVKKRLIPDRGESFLTCSTARANEDPPSADACCLQVCVTNGRRFESGSPGHVCWDDFGGLVAVAGFCRPLYDLSFPPSSSLFLINISLRLDYCNYRTIRHYFFTHFEPCG